MNGTYLSPLSLWERAGVRENRPFKAPHPSLLDSGSMVVLSPASMQSSQRAKE